MATDVLVIGAGFGGLGAALGLAERGAKVTVCEALAYPGGCASTFSRKGARFEAGATLFSGLGPDQVFGRWIQRYELPVEVDWIDPVCEVRTPALSLPVLRDREAFLDAMCRRPGAPEPGLRQLFSRQRAVADTLWALLDDPELMPPWTASNLLAHIRRSPRYLALLPYLGRPLAEVLRRFVPRPFAPLDAWLGGLCQITVQAPPEEAETPFAMAAMDYYWRGTGHIRGGVGRLADGLCAAIGRQGGELRFADRVTALRREGSGWIAETRSGPREAAHVVANLLPGDLAALLGGHGALEELHRPVAEAWGAVMLYRVVRGDFGAAKHLDLTADPSAPLTDGNHVFVSLSGPEDERGAGGHRVLTASTHVALEALRRGDPARLVGEVQARMRQTIARLAPEVDDVVLEMTASPRTFQRFLRRREGAVGGVPRRAGLGAYASVGPVSPEEGLWLVGDSVFPGQSITAAAVGGLRVAAAIAGA